MVMVRLDAPCAEQMRGDGMVGPFSRIRLVEDGSDPRLELTMEPTPTPPDTAEWWRSVAQELATEIAVPVAPIRAENEKLRADLEAARAALADLHVAVKGECPSILNEDSGGDAALDLRIERVLAGSAPRGRSNPCRP
jgi:hypothetical protein